MDDSYAATSTTAIAPTKSPMSPGMDYAASRLSW
jgi:hypothetical protein